MMREAVVEARLLLPARVSFADLAFWAIVASLVLANI
jgi:hypothetical protein